MSRRIGSALFEPEYLRDFTPSERALLGFFAVHAVMMINSGRCKDSTTSMEETFLFIFMGLMRQAALQPALALPKARQDELIAQTMTLADQGLAEVGSDFSCPPHSELLSESAAPSLADRKARTRNLLGMALSAASSPAPSDATPPEKAAP